MSASITVNPQNVSGLVRAALAIAEERAQLLEQMKQAFEAHDDTRALEFAKRLCGVEPNESVREKQH